MRQIILDTETTGFNPLQGDKIIEIGAIELIKRKLTGHNYHQYVQPQRKIPEDATRVHGITDADIAHEPIFAVICDDFMEYVKGAELIIHNAPFDVGFINAELANMKPNKWGKIEDHCQITDSLKMARKAFPGQRATLDALAKRFTITSFNRDFHGALLDSEILAQVYLAMTGGQTDLILADKDNHTTKKATRARSELARAPLKVISPSQAELTKHRLKLDEIAKKQEQLHYW